ncbi:MAG: hypothetical protein AAF549_09820 [Pseudomonadota bacterium]
MLKDSLASEMECSLVSNKNSDIILLHDQPLNGVVDYIEFHPETNQMLLIYEDGEMQEFGHKIEAAMAANIQNGTMVQVTLIVDKVIQSIEKTTFLVQEY